MLLVEIHVIILLCRMLGDPQQQNHENPGFMASSNFTCPKNLYVYGIVLYIHRTVNTNSNIVIDVLATYIIMHTINKVRYNATTLTHQSISCLRIYSHWSLPQLPEYYC